MEKERIEMEERLSREREDAISRQERKAREQQLRGGYFCFFATFIPSPSLVAPSRDLFLVSWLEHITGSSLLFFIYLFFFFFFAFS